MTLEIAPDVAREIRENAAREGVSESDYLARLMQSARLTPTDNFAVASADPAARVRALLTKLQEADGMPFAPTIPAKTLFAQWDAEDANMTDEEREAEDRIWENYMQRLNETRATFGLRLL